MVEDENAENDELNNEIKRIAERLKDERRKCGFSQMDLSFRAGLSQNLVNYIETGKRTPNLYTILKICKALDISPAALFKNEEEERRSARETVISLVSKYM
jgi:transcriptional regulator with XRE-family HTH domain